MEKVKGSSHSLKRSFMATVAITMLVVVLCSAATIYACFRVQKFLLPDSNEVWLYNQKTYGDGTSSKGKQRVQLGESFMLSEFVINQGNKQESEVVEYTIEKIESSFDVLSPKRKLLYRGMSVSMIAFPLSYSVIGIAICAWWFYRKKIAPPVQILADATEHIRAQDLDFEVHAVSQDELGQLCEAFEKMRQTLYENNRELWGMIENRRTLQASVAHDLRNPIAIIEGYIEYMQQNIPSGKLSGEKLEHTLSNLAVTAKRLERYTDYIRDLHALEETEIRYTDVALPDYLNGIADGFRVMAEGQGKCVKCEFEMHPCTVALDKEVVARILENVFSNALRYAKEEIRFCAFLDQNTMTVHIIDDGRGFSEHMLKKKSVLFYSEDTTGEHMGLGLATSRTLCQKHGGGIELSNADPHGACVKITIATKIAGTSE